MSTLNIKSALGLGEMATVPSLGPVKFEKIYAPRTPTQPWNCMLNDGESEVRAAFWDREDMNPLLGQVRVINSVVGCNKRLGGVQVKTGMDKQG
jgi:hypothetical protein